MEDNLQAACGWVLVVVATFCAVWSAVPRRRRVSAAGLALAMASLLLFGAVAVPSSWEVTGFGLALAATAWVLLPVISARNPSNEDAHCRKRNHVGSRGDRSRLLSSSRTWSTEGVGMRKSLHSESRRRSRT